MVLQPGDHRFVVAPGQTVLEAGLAAGLLLESSCRNGTCRSCLCQLVQGSVQYRVEWPGVSAEEKAQGWFLPCVALPQTPLVMQQPGL